MAQGKIGETINLLKEAVELEPRFGNSHWFLGMAYKINEQYELALEEMLKAAEYGYYWKNDSVKVGIVIETCQFLGKEALLSVDADSLLEYFIERVESNSSDTEAWIFLATSYANLGRFEKAKQTALRSMEVNPDSRSKMEEFLESLPQ